MNNKSIVMQKSDTDSSTVPLDKSKYLQAMSKILNNNTKFKLLQLDNEKNSTIF